MEYRILPHGGEKISVIGLGMGSIHNADTAEIVNTLHAAIDAGVNYLDFVPSKACAFDGYAKALRGKRDLKDILAFLDSSPAERDYSIIGEFAPPEISGTCVYCNHCQPCPEGISIGLANKYYDLARMGDAVAAEHYRNLERHASDCIQCGHCNDRCPFGVDQVARMREMSAYFGE